MPEPVAAMPNPVLSIIDRRIFWGPSPYAPEQAVLCALALSAPAAQLAAALDRFVQAYPDWVLDDPTEGDLRRRAAHAIAAWALAALNEVRGCVRIHGVVRFEAAASQPADDPLWLFVGFHQPELAFRALALGTQLMADALALEGGATPARLRSQVQTALDRLWADCQWQHPDYQACILMEFAHRAGIPVLPVSTRARVWQFGWGQRGRMFLESASNADGLVGYALARDKSLSKDALRALGVPTPSHVLVNDASELTAAVQVIGWPCVVKPVDQGGGRGVTAGIRCADALLRAHDWARQFSPSTSIMLESFCKGDDHRLLVVDGELVAAIVRRPAQVCGDGQQTVLELIGGLNAQRSRNKQRSRYQVPIPIDEALLNHLRGLGVGLNDRLPLGQWLTLRSNANLSTGGVAQDVTDRVHPEIHAMARRLTTALGMSVAGLDLMTTDVSKPMAETGAQVIEINHTPGLDLIMAAGIEPDGLLRRVLGPRVGRVPTTLRIVAPQDLAQERETWLASRRGPGDAWVMGQEVGVGDWCRKALEPGAWSAVAQALRDPATERLLVVCTPDELYQWGMPLDRFDQVQLRVQGMVPAWQGLLERAAPKHPLIFKPQ